MTTALVRRRVIVRLMSALLALVATAAGLVIAEPAHAASAPCGYVRLYRATATTSILGRGGTVDTGAGNWIGSDYYTGGTVYPSPFGGFDHLAFAGAGLRPRTYPKYEFRYYVGGGLAATYQPFVSYNGVMRDDNYDYRNRIYVGYPYPFLGPNVYTMTVTYIDGCVPVTFTKTIGNVQIS